MIKFSEDKEGNYSSECGHQIKREHTGNTPNGNSFGGKWVLRSGDAKLIDWDTYINDLAERNDLDIYSIKLSMEDV
jgi:hypothetical protein